MLLVVLATTLFIFLILAIVAIVLVVKILSNVNKATQKVSVALDSVPEFAKLIGKRMAPVAVSTLVSTILKRARDKRKYKEDDDE
jgi:membrane protein implicated in regulation of membrane protease activity